MTAFGRFWAKEPLVTQKKKKKNCEKEVLYIYLVFFFLFFFTLLLSSFWTSRGHRCRPFFPPVLAFNFFIAHRVQQSHCSSIFHRVLLTHALALSASQIVHKKKSQRPLPRGDSVWDPDADIKIETSAVLTKWVTCRASLCLPGSPCPLAMWLQAALRRQSTFTPPQIWC